MKVWDAELLTAKKELSPVTDGLLFWLDGQDELFHYASPTSDYKDYMYERVNGYKVDFSGNLVAHTENGFLVTELPSGSSSGTYTINQSRFPASFDDIRTVEYVSYKCTAFFINGFGAANSNWSFGVNNWGKALIPTSTFSDYMQLVGVMDTDRKPCIYCNGTLSATGQGNNGTLSGKPNIKFRWQASLGCVRLYNRVLSPEEIAQNLEYEVSIGRVVL